MSQPSERNDPTVLGAGDDDHVWTYILLGAGGAIGLLFRPGGRRVARRRAVHPVQRAVAVDR